MLIINRTIDNKKSYEIYIRRIFYYQQYYLTKYGDKLLKKK